MAVANQRLKDLKAEIKAYIEKKGSEANMTVEVDQPPEVDNNELEGIQPSESGRENNSGKMGETSTDPGK